MIRSTAESISSYLGGREGEGVSWLAGRNGAVVAQQQQQQQQRHAPDLSLAAADRVDGRLVHEVLERRSGEPRGAARDGLEVDPGRERLAAGVHLEDGGAAAEVGQVDDDAAVEAARAQQGAVEHVGAVGGGDADDARVALEAVHLREDLVERLLALVVAAGHAGAALPPHRVDLVDEDDARGVLLGLPEEVAHARRAHAHEHLHELGPRDGEERHPALAGHRLGQQRLARAGRALEDHAARDACAEVGVPLGVFEEVHDLGGKGGRGRV